MNGLKLSLNFKGQPVTTDKVERLTLVVIPEGTVIKVASESGEMVFDLQHCDSIQLTVVASVYDKVVEPDPRD